MSKVYYLWSQPIAARFRAFDGAQSLDMDIDRQLD